VLFTTYISTLPKVLELLLERLTLDIAGRVGFRGLHAFASRLMKERGNLYVGITRARDGLWLGGRSGAVPGR
jgi:hypothetical protein